MSDLLESLKKNIVPLQNAIRNKTNLFIDSMAEHDIYEYDNYEDDTYSEDFESETDDFTPPKQYRFDSSIDSYSPIICEENNYKKEIITTIQSQNIFNQNILNDDNKNMADNEIVVKNKIVVNNENVADNEIQNNYTVEDDKKEIKKYVNNDLLIKNLVIIGNLEKNQKLYINNLDDLDELNFEIMIDNSYIPQFSRWYYSQNRVNTINMIEKLIDITLKEINYYKNSNTSELVNKLENLLRESTNGISNLIKTYENDNENSQKLIKIIKKINEYF